jgi:hypothetical protein
MIDDARFHALSAQAVKALMYLAAQYNGRNNGDLGVAWKVAKAKGVTSHGALCRGTRELLDTGFIVTSRQGGRNRCSLYALTWFAVDECGGKLDIPASRLASNDWLKRAAPTISPLVQSSMSPVVQCVSPVVQSEKKSRRNGVH